MCPGRWHTGAFVISTARSDLMINFEGPSGVTPVKCPPYLNFGANRAACSRSLSTWGGISVSMSSWSPLGDSEPSSSTCPPNQPNMDSIFGPCVTSRPPTPGGLCEEASRRRMGQECGEANCFATLTSWRDTH